MSWTEVEWEAFATLLEEAWPGEFDDSAREVYRLLLGDLEPVPAGEALKRLLYSGQRFRPSVAELLAALRDDPGRPTFEEAVLLIFGGAGCCGILDARPAQRVFYDDEEGLEPWRSAAQKKRAAERDAIDQACRAAHPLIGGFVLRQGIDRLRLMPLDDPDHGHFRRRELREAWDAHVGAFDGRETAALAAGGRRGELGRLDPVAALGVRGAGLLPAGGEER